MKKFGFLLCYFYSFFLVAQTNTDFESFYYITPQQDTLPYCLLYPKDYKPTATYPLVLYLHGAGERGKDNEITTKHIIPLFEDEKRREKFPCFILVPQCAKGNKWVEVDWKADAHTQLTAPSRYLNLTMQLLDSLMQKLPIAANKLYITGISMGGYGTWDVITRYPKKFAAAIPICGGADDKTASQINKMPIWVFHGSLDKVVKPERSRRMVQALRKLGSKVKYTEYKKVAHNSWVNAYQEPALLPWLFEQKLPN